MANRLSGWTRIFFGLGRRRHATTLSQRVAFAAVADLDVAGIDVASAPLWQKMIAANAEVFALGAEAPDVEFKDFKNHVLYPRDGYWGGAPDKAHIWYRNLVQALKRQEWETASYCAGVLAHYVSDVTDPFNTQWSDAGGTLHLAVRRSLREDFDTLAAMAHVGTPAAIELDAGADFLARALGAAADRANAVYEKAIAHYDLARGATEPRAGFDVVGEKLAIELVGRAIALTSAVFARAIADAGVAPPATSANWRTAGWQLLTMPVGTIDRMRYARHEARDVHAMHDEVILTGGVEATLPEHDRRVRDAYQVDVVAKRVATPIAKVFPFEPSEASLKRVGKLREQRTEAAAPAGEVVAFNRARVAIEPPRPAPKRVEAPAVRSRADVIRDINAEVAAATEESKVEAKVEAKADVPAAEPASNVIPMLRETPIPRESHTDGPKVEPLPEPAAPAVAAATGTAEVARAAPEIERLETGKIYLRADQDIVDAPSIGPKTAGFLRAVGIDTVEDFLRSHPIALAARLEQKAIDAETLESWQDQCRLVMSVPGLRGTHAQLLVGAGYRSLDAVAAAEIEKLCADVLTYATSVAGKRVLRDGAAPSIERVRAWAESARAVKAA